MNNCDHCSKTEAEQGAPIDCQVWYSRRPWEHRNLTLCDDCFFNEKYVEKPIWNDEMGTPAFKLWEDE